jgi:signal transduction histidine kinase
VRTHLYRIAQEALSNVARHSGARHCQVRWAVHSARQVELRISDDGTGFDPGVAYPGHFGLDNMRSRALEIGAQLTLTSAPGQGTQLHVRWEGPKA